MCRCEFSRLEISLRRVTLCSVRHLLLVEPLRGQNSESHGLPAKGTIHPFAAALGSTIHSPCQADTHPHPFIQRRWLPREPWAVLQRWMSTTDLTTRIWQFFFNTIMHFQPVFFNVPTHGFSTSCHHVVAAFCTGDVSMVSCPFWAKLGPIFAHCSYFQITSLVLSKKLRLSLFSSCCSPEESSQLIVYM